MMSACPLNVRFAHQRLRLRPLFWLLLMLAALPGVLATPGSAQDIKATELYQRIKASLDAVPAIDTHDHLRSFAELPHRVETPAGTGMTLFSLWAGSYYRWINPLTPWPPSGQFTDWWQQAQHDFDNARATSFYRYMLPAFQDLYGVDFDRLTAQEAEELNARIFANYQDDRWLREVVLQRANIELMLVDPYWARLKYPRDYHFTAPVLNVSVMMQASHPARAPDPLDSPYAYAAEHGLPIATLADFLAVVEAIFADAVRHDCVCLKSTQAYQRTLHYEKVDPQRAAVAFGRPPAEVTTEDQKAFEDFMFWHVCRLSAKYELPFQVHTGQARIQGSNPMLLVDLIAENPETKFVLFHGGFPWVGETGVIAMRYKNVWIDSVWLPTLSYTMARRAYQEWLEVVPSDRIMWGADTVNAEGIYAATEFTRMCLAEALAEKVHRGELLESHALQIGRQILRDNALKLFPKLNRMLWREPS